MRRFSLLLALPCLVLACSSTGGDGQEPDTSSRFVEYSFAVNIVDPELEQHLVRFLRERDPNEMVAPSEAFYELYRDEYDFLFFMSPEYIEDTGVRGLHQEINRDGEAGIDVTEFHHPAYESHRLKSVIALNWDRRSRHIGMAHEVAHHWAVSFDASFGFGDGFEGGEAAHWGWSGVHGVLGGFDPRTLRCEAPEGATPPDCALEENGRMRVFADYFLPFSSRYDEARLYAPLELYSMGLATKEEVSPIPVLRGVELLDPGDYVFPVLMEIDRMDTVTIDDVISVHGPRRPRPEELRHFKGALVVLSSIAASPEFMDVAEFWAKGFGGIDEILMPSFETLTQGRASFDMSIGPRKYDRFAPPIVPQTPYGTWCDVLEQNCPEREACYGETNSYCVVAGTRTEGQSCSIDADCSAGLGCSFPNYLGESSGFCSPYCDLTQTKEPRCELCPHGDDSSGPSDVEIARCNP